MQTQSVTIDLPQAMYTRLKERAVQANRTVEAELVQVVAAVVPIAGELTPDLTALLAQMPALDDKALWQAAHHQLSCKAQAQLQALSYKRQNGGLTEAEALKANALLQQSERILLVRAQAIFLIKERGQDISEFSIKA